MCASHLDADDVHKVSEDRKSCAVEEEGLRQHLGFRGGTGEAHRELEQAQHGDGYDSSPSRDLAAGRRTRSRTRTSSGNSNSNRGCGYVPNEILEVNSVPSRFEQFCNDLSLFLLGA